MKSRSLVVLLALAVPAVLHAQAKPKSAMPAPPTGMKSSGKPLSNALYIKAAEEGAPASISATLSGVDSRALWSSTNRITYWLMAKPEVKNISELRRKKIGVSGLGGTSHVALTVALEKRGLGPKDYVTVSVPGGMGFVTCHAATPSHVTKNDRIRIRRAKRCM